MPSTIWKPMKIVGIIYSQFKDLISKNCQYLGAEKSRHLSTKKEANSSFLFFFVFFNF